MKRCLFCCSSVHVGIHNYCGNDHTVKDDILEFFGHQIEDRLYSDDAVCSFCQKLMDALAKLKRRLLPFIYREGSDVLKPIKFKKKYEILASLNYDGEDDPIQHSRSPTPNLIKCKSIVPYDDRKERRLAEMERYRTELRSASRASVLSTRSDVSTEVANVFTSNRKKRKRKKGHNWSQRKNGKYSRAGSVSRSKTSMSGLSTTSRQTSIYERRSADLSSSLWNNNFDLDESSAPQLTFKIGPNQQKSLDVCRIMTQSVSQEEEDETVYLENETIEHPCNQEDCDFMTENLESLVEHKIAVHNCLALYFCHCGQKYTTSDELNEHKDMTHVNEIICDICHEMFELKEQFSIHWETEHLRNSVKCPYCSRRFINEKSCDKHVSFEHRNGTLRRIDFSDCSGQVNTQNDSFQVRLLVQHPPENGFEFTL